MQVHKVKLSHKIEGETLNKLITRNFRSKTTVSVKTDYEATNIKVIEAYYNRNCNYLQDSIKNIEAIMSYSNVINPVYLIHGTAEVQLQYLRSILDNTIISLLKMVVPDWLQTEVAIKINSQTDITIHVFKKHQLLKKKLPCTKDATFCRIHSDTTTTANDVANVPPVTQRAAIVNTTLTNDDTRVPASK
ncbi:hypothetical protein ACTFIZ_007562 [Dictyostelium cf. discoideum]